jgi:hypothetical protein
LEKLCIFVQFRLLIQNENSLYSNPLKDYAK